MEVLRAFPIAEFTPSTPCTVAGLFWYPASGTMVSLKDLFKGIAQAIFFGEIWENEVQIQKIGGFALNFQRTPVEDGMLDY